MLMHLKAREDRNAPAPKAKKVSAQKLLRQLHQAIGKTPIKTAPKVMR